MTEEAGRLLTESGFTLHGPHTALLPADLASEEQRTRALQVATQLREAGHTVVLDVSIDPADPTVTQQIVSAKTVSDNIADWAEDIHGLDQPRELGQALTTLVGDHASVLAPLADLLEHSAVRLDDLRAPNAEPLAERLHRLGTQIRMAEIQIDRIGMALLAMDRITPADTDTGKGPPRTQRAADPALTHLAQLRLAEATAHRADTAHTPR